MNDTTLDVMISSESISLSLLTHSFSLSHFLPPSLLCSIHRRVRPQILTLVDDVVINPLICVRLSQIFIVVILNQHR